MFIFVTVATMLFNTESNCRDILVRMFQRIDHILLVSSLIRNVNTFHQRGFKV